MVKPVVAFGDPVLKAEAQEIEKGHKGLESLIDDMWETMYSAEGVGIAAPQVGESIRMFVVDGTPFGEDDDVCVNYVVFYFKDTAPTSISTWWFVGSIGFV